MNVRTQAAGNVFFPDGGARGQVRFERLGSLEELDRLAASWPGQGPEAGNPFAHFIWVRPSVSPFHAGATPHVVAEFRDNQLVALAPLVCKQLRGVRRLFLAGDELCEPMDLIWTDPQSLQLLARKLVREGRPLTFTRIPADSASLSAVRRAFRLRAITVTRSAPTSPYIALDESWAAPETHLNSRRRGDLRRAARRAEALGTVTTEIIRPMPGEVDLLLDQCLAVEARSWKGDAGSALVHDNPRASFYRDYARLAAMAGVLRVCLLRIGERIAAMQIAVEQGGAFWLLKIGYDAAFASCSPGVLLMRDTIRYAAKSGLRAYEFLGTTESWTNVWTTTQHHYAFVRIYPFGIRGMTALAVDAASYMIQQIARRAASIYVAGDHLTDALRVAGRLRKRRLASTLGYWNVESDAPRVVADEYLAGIEALAGHPGAYLSIKIPALRFSYDLMAEIVACAACHRVRLHFDSHALETVDRSLSVIDRFRNAGAELSISLPGRWSRSVADAAWAIERAIKVRVVKGQWPDPRDPSRDMRTGYLEVIDALAGRARHVAVATHDADLAIESVRRLRAAGSACELELLYGLPMRRSLDAARRQAVNARIYVPYGKAFLPYALSRLQANPRIVWWLIRDWLASAWTRQLAALKPSYHKQINVQNSGRVPDDTPTGNSASRRNVRLQDGIQRGIRQVLGQWN